MPPIQWLIVALIAVAVVSGLVLFALRRRALPPATTPPELPTGESSDLARGEFSGAGPAVLEPEAEVAAPPWTPAEIPAAPSIEVPESPASRMVRLRRRLAGSNNALARALATLLTSDRIDEDTWEDFETTLITSDLGVGPTTELVDSLRSHLAVEGIADPAKAREALRRELVALVDPAMDRGLNLRHPEGVPAVVMMVGVNGTGKTTTVGKLARMLVAEGKTVLLGAADTFRAAAAEQLTTWGSRVGVGTVRGEEGADPASVAFSAVETAMAAGIDIVLVDTAGRLHTKVGLMDELGKVKRVIEKQAPVSEVLLVIDATTGQNGLAQARVFAEVVDVSGIVLTKLDGSAKGGIVIQVQRELGVPVKFIGLGEGADDLAPFIPEQFVAGLLGE